MKYGRRTDGSKTGSKQRRNPSSRSVSIIGFERGGTTRLGARVCASFVAKSVQIFTFVWVSFLGGRNPYRQLKTHPLVRTVPVLRRAARRSPSRAPQTRNLIQHHGQPRREKGSSKHRKEPERGSVATWSCARGVGEGLVGESALAMATRILCFYLFVAFGI